MKRWFVSWKPVLRLAFRDIQRNRRRSVLIACLVAVPVLAMAVVSVIYQSQKWDTEDELRAQMGAAQARILWQALNPIEQSADAGVTVSNVPVDQEGLGQLNPAQYQELLSRRIPADDTLVAERWTSVNQTQVQWPGIAERKTVSLRELDYTAAGIDGLVEQVSGRAPARPGEVVVSEDLTSQGLAEGDVITYRAAEGQGPVELTVVGVVDSYHSTARDSILGMPGTLLPQDLFDLPRSQREKDRRPVAVEWLVTGPSPVTWSHVRELNKVGAVVFSKEVFADPSASSLGVYSSDGTSRPSRQTAVIVVVVAGLALLQIALLAGPAIAVGAWRNQRDLALIAAAGGSRAHLRRVLLASYGVIGLVSSVAAAVVGGLAGVLVVAGLRQWGDPDMPRIDLHFTDLFALVLVGTLTVVMTALVPAQQIARMNVARTLTGRRSRGSGPVRLLLPLIGGAVAVGGLALAVQTTRGFIADPARVVVGLGLFEIGLVMTVGAVVATAARLSRGLPFRMRFALRDASRQRTRTAPAVAAVLAAVAGGTAGLVYFASAEDHQARVYNAAGELGVVRVTGTDPFLSTTGAVEPLDRAEKVLAEELGTDDIADFSRVKIVDGNFTTYLEPERQPNNRCEGSTGNFPTNSLEICYWEDHALKSLDGDVFDDGSALAVLTGGRAEEDVAALRAGRVVVADPAQLRPDGMVQLTVQRHTRDGKEQESTQVVLPATLATGELRLPQPVFPIGTAPELGVELVPGGLVAQPPQPLSESQEDSVRAALMATGQVSQVEVERGYQETYRLTVLALLVAAGVISLVATFTAVGLAVTESRADLSTLSTLGAEPGLRKWLGAGQGAVIAGLGTVLGLGSGVLAGYVLVRLARPAGVQFSDSAIWEFIVPWPHLLGVGLGIPLIAMGVGSLVARRPLPPLRRVGL
ncbi:hypothetical protein Kisp01_08430 [Kineosporia sp. NBRC 101677]|uniref:FtsX-like permease family protein n=1 Tax=Kineosporia sp. NBRC 101677 TaxID=3032197 RepID=UPI0024A2E143|nr:FtsX-like permease family protein [Kineosporia sp. NBRC 101677]GLY13827.1 hypothetical protein Kisp01_08430 [Kineosporia sp. NBRC 101677]